jgi:hypothetical protein
VPHDDRVTLQKRHRPRHAADLWQFVRWLNQIAVRAFRFFGGVGIPGYSFPKHGKPRGRPRVGANAGLHIFAVIAAGPQQ